MSISVQLDFFLYITTGGLGSKQNEKVLAETGKLAISTEEKHTKNINKLQKVLFSNIGKICRSVKETGFDHYKLNNLYPAQLGNL